ncbi:hypothetical protein P23_0669 [Acinetobacter calcoaceticus]|nr:hypothetical protein P23_0669 [Acinetobacter calcoaceticus]
MLLGVFPISLRATPLEEKPKNSYFIHMSLKAQ